ncbi:hypothetical protein CC86DRAFT_454737 [Ophiobolus disseminans]|uniref:Uncharacterized protein n=1 Tax=Ophiobolus disseminans TaxID=1469910 RepID=A0A6A7A3X9_9PLEO|nr:hypothetical protein CC86DRAFT_454737 [Ophiobolus disseminans]
MTLSVRLVVQQAEYWVMIAVLQETSRRDNSFLTTIRLVRVALERCCDQRNRVLRSAFHLVDLFGACSFYLLRPGRGQVDFGCLMSSDGYLGAASSILFAFHNYFADCIEVPPRLGVPESTNAKTFRPFCVVVSYSPHFPRRN